MHIDNSGEGNCLYYAYSISLMYYLRKANNTKITEDIFNKLKLQEEDRAHLRKLLFKEADLPFTREEIKTIIEPILGKATRDLAAEHTKVEFKTSPQDTPLFASTKYGMDFGFKKSFELLATERTRRESESSLQAPSLITESELEDYVKKLLPEEKLEAYFKKSFVINESELVGLIDHDFSNPDYIEAEIYNLSEIFDNLHRLVFTRMFDVVDEFNNLWKNKSEEIKGQKLDEITIQQYKAVLLNEIISNETVNFFLLEDEKYLNQYKDHLQENHKWGSEETLMVLHRAIQGERMVRNSEGTIDIIYDNVIVLHLHRDGSSPFFQDGIPEMLLNNKGNAHWTSVIPETIFTSNLHEKEQELHELLGRIQADYINKPLEIEKFSISDWIYDLKKQVDVIKASKKNAEKEKEIEIFFQLLAKATLKLVSDPSLRMTLSNLFSLFLECTPIFLVENKISTGLTQLGFYRHEKGPRVSPAQNLLTESEASADVISSQEEMTKIIKQKEESSRSYITSNLGL